MTVEAVCYKCGAEKNDPLKMCGSCHALPESDEDRIISLCLSAQCLKQKHLAVANKFIRKKNKLPGFHPSVEKKARKIHASLPRRPVSASQSIELSASFFSEDLIQDDAPEEVTVHAIGKPEKLAVSQFANVQGQRTYHQLTWTVGLDISQSDADTYSDSTGQLYIWYRWINEKWTMKFVTKREFAKMREMETANS